MHLGGLDIASLLIKETAEALQASFPTLHTFSTLSPIPKFTTYLAKVMDAFRRYL
ncbi:hypothetical protein EON65_31485 [archaeon]|nr:MAG: hypothetical protein EON65_31485 [archaeon]